MADTPTLTIQMTEQSLARLQALAAQTGQSPADVAGEAVEAYLDLQEWQVAAIGEALEASAAGEQPIEHERMAAWLRSWGTENELPPPE